MADAEPASQASPVSCVSEPADITPDTLYTDCAQDGDNDEHGCLIGVHPRPSAMQQPFEGHRVSTGSDSSSLDLRTSSWTEESIATPADAPAGLVADVDRESSDSWSPHWHTPSTSIPSPLSSGDDESEDGSSHASLLLSSCLEKTCSRDSVPFDGDCLAKVTNEKARLLPKGELPTEKGDEQQPPGVANQMSKVFDEGINIGYHGQKINLGVITAFPAYEVRAPKNLEAASKDDNTGRVVEIFAQEEKHRRRPDRFGSFRGNLNEEISFLYEEGHNVPGGRSRHNLPFGDEKEEDDILSDINAVGKRGHRRRKSRELPLHEPAWKGRQQEKGWDSPDVGDVKSVVDGPTGEIGLRPILKNPLSPACSHRSSHSCEVPLRRENSTSRTRHSARRLPQSPREAVVSRSVTTVVHSRSSAHDSSDNSSASELAQTACSLLQSATGYARGDPQHAYKQQPDSVTFPTKNRTASVVPHVCDDHSRSHFRFRRKPAVRSMESGWEVKYKQSENLKPRRHCAKNKHEAHRSLLMQGLVKNTRGERRQAEEKDEGGIDRKTTLAGIDAVRSPVECSVGTDYYTDVTENSGHDSTASRKKEIKFCTEVGLHRSKPLDTGLRDSEPRYTSMQAPDIHWRQRKDEPIRSTTRKSIIVHRNIETSLEDEDVSRGRLSTPVRNRDGYSRDRVKEGYKCIRKRRKKRSCFDNVKPTAEFELRKHKLKHAREHAKDGAVPFLKTSISDSLVIEIDTSLSRDSESVQEPRKRSYSDSETQLTTKARSVTFGLSQSTPKARSVTFARSQSSFLTSDSGVEKLSNTEISRNSSPEEHREPSVDDGSLIFRALTGHHLSVPRGKTAEDQEDHQIRNTVARIGTRNSELYAVSRTQTTGAVCTTIGSKSVGHLPSNANSTSPTDALTSTWAVTHTVDRPTLSSVKSEPPENYLKLFPEQWATQMTFSPESDPSYRAWTMHEPKPFQRECQDKRPPFDVGCYPPMLYSNTPLFPREGLEPYRYVNAQQTAMPEHGSFIPLPKSVPSPYPSVATPSVFTQPDLPFNWGRSFFPHDKLQRIWPRPQPAENPRVDFRRNQGMKGFFFKHGISRPVPSPVNTEAPANCNVSFGTALRITGTEAFIPRPNNFFDRGSSVQYMVPPMTSPTDSPAQKCNTSAGSISKDRRRPPTSNEDKPSAEVQDVASAQSCTTSEINDSLSSDSRNSVAWEVSFFDGGEPETTPAKVTSTDSLTLGTKDRAFMKKFILRGFNSFCIILLVCTLAGIAAGWSMLTNHSEHALTTENEGDTDSDQEFMSGPWFDVGDAVGVKRASCFRPLCSKQVAQLVHSLHTAVPPCQNFYGHVCSPPRSNGMANEQLKQQTESRLITFFKGIGSPDMDLPVAAASRRLWKDCTDLTTLHRQGKAPLHALLNQTGLGGWPYGTGHTASSTLPDVWEVAGQLQRLMAIAPLLEISALPDGTVHITRGAHSGSDEVDDVLKVMSALIHTDSRLRKSAADVADMGRRLRGLGESLPSASLPDEGEQSDVLPRAFLEVALKGLLPNLGSALTEPAGAIQQLVALVNESSPQTVLNYLGYRLVQHVYLLTPAGVKAKLKSDAVHSRESQCANAVLQDALPGDASEYVRYAALRSLTDFKSVREALAKLKGALDVRLTDLHLMDASTLKSARRHLSELKVLFLFDRYEDANASAQVPPIAFPSRALATYQRFREARFRSRLLQGVFENHDGKEHCVYDADNKVLYVRLSAVDVRDTGSPQWRLLQAAWMGPRVSRCLLRVLFPTRREQHGRQSMQRSPTASDRLNALRACLHAQQRARYAVSKQSGGSEQGGALLALTDSAALGPARDVFDAYAARLADKNPESEPTEDTAWKSFGWDKVFYVAYARSLCEETSQGRPFNQWASDSERVNALLSNDRGFQQAFQCQRGDAMFPRTHCAFWNAHR